MSTKSANLYVRIEPNIKEEAENILNELGLSSSSAINMFYKQIILRNGLPFEAVLPKNNKKNDEIDNEQEKSEEIVFAKL